MGMGEPLHNYDATMKALRIVGDEPASACSRAASRSRRSAWSGHREAGAEPLMPNLAISLHATHEEQRDAIVPATAEYRSRTLIDACRRFPLKRRSRITFEYVLLEGVNDTPEDARRLVKLLDRHQGQGQPDAAERRAGIPFERPDDRVDAFAQILAERRDGLGAQEPRPRHQSAR